MEKRHFHVKPAHAYIVQAALEYFLSIIVGGTYLAVITKALGVPDNITGILSSVISLGCLFQLLSIPLGHIKKRTILISSILYQLLFMSLYVIPLTNFSQSIKVTLLVVAIVGAYLLYNIIHPKKINWLMSFIDNEHRGTFTANKEIISLIGGILFSFGTGMLVDHYSALGQVSQYFTLAIGIIIVLISLHTVSLAVIKEKEEPIPAKIGLLKHIKELFSDKKILQITLVFALYYASSYICTPFYSTYKIGELGLSLTFLSALGMCGSVARISVSKLWGRIADKTSFASMIEKCFFFLLAAQLCMCFAIPANGALMVLLYFVLHGIALGGVNSALINLVFDYVPAEKRADSLAITQAAAGLTGFVITLLASPMVDHIQKNGNVFMGIPMYAQQVLSAFSAIIIVIAIIFVRMTMINKSKVNTEM